MKANQPENQTNTEETLIKITEEAHLYDQENVTRAFVVVRAEMARIERATLEDDTPADSPEAEKVRKLMQAVSLPQRAHELSIAASALTELIQRERHLYGLDALKPKTAAKGNQVTQAPKLVEQQNDETHKSEPTG